MFEIEISPLAIPFFSILLIMSLLLACRAARKKQ